MKKKLLSWLLVFSMIFSITGITSQAEELTHAEADVQSTQQQENEPATTVVPEQQEAKQEVSPAAIAEETSQDDVVETAAAVIGIRRSSETTRKKFPYNGFVNSENSTINYIANGSSVRLQYDDGTEGKYVYPSDYLKNEYHLYIKDAGTGTKVEFNDSQYLPVGSYELYLTYQSFEVKLSDFTIVYPGDCVDKVLTTSTPVEYKASGSQRLVTKFVPEEDGTYIFTKTTPDVGAYLYFYVRDEKGNYLFYNEGNAATASGTLKGGQSYYVYCDAYHEVTLSVRQNTSTVVGIQKVANPSQTVFPESVIGNETNTVFAKAAVDSSVQLKYSDGSLGTALKSYKWKDNGFKAQVKNKSTGKDVQLDTGTYVSLPIGSYELYLLYNNIQTKITDFSIKSAEDCVDKIMTESQPASYPNVDNSTDRVTKFVAPETTTYKFSCESEQDNLYFSIRDKNGYVDSSYKNGSNVNNIIHKLEAGKTYYVYASPYKNTTFSVSKHIASVTGMKASGTSEYGTDMPLSFVTRTSHSMVHISFGVAVQLSFEDGTSSTVGAEDLEQYGVSYELEDSKGGELPLDLGEPYAKLPVGSYQLYAKKDTIKEKLMDFTVKAPADMVDKTLTLGAPVDYSITGLTNTVTKFTVTEPALYSISESKLNQSAGLTCSIYKNDGTYIPSNSVAGIGKAQSRSTYLPVGDYYIYQSELSNFSLSAETIDVKKIELDDNKAPKDLVLESAKLERLRDAIDELSPTFKMTLEDGKTASLTFDDLTFLNYGSTFGVRPTSVDWVDDATAPAGTYYLVMWLANIGQTEESPLGKIDFWVFDGYNDVSVDSWYYESVGKMSAQSIMTGLSAGTFGPADNLARAQFATILYRMEGSPAVEYTNTFPDVSDGQFYSKPVIWANQQGIVGGYSNGYFGPGDSINREQIAVMMYRYAKSKGYDVSAYNDLSGFPDKSSVNAFATEAMQWAVGAELISGTGAGTQKRLEPQGNAVRAQCATIIMRFMEKYEN